ncbi:hypothetical protein FNU79_12115 [Deinococcus detaillensis]|uniref:DUF4402 domain-containing protein n=1 Tax=Deinococcus detaillensis TaxID=2592048 RepID=A0A553UU45_9DEIO|nr:hypothetical protein [Deinococcus detaillensis]TSA83739.1 hypothetical protein FNU79_12115 [Deinococcus detaillensis]
MNAFCSRATLTSLVVLLASSATAQTKAQQSSVTVQIPAGAKSLILSRSTMNLSVLALPAGIKQVALTLNLNAARYQEGVTLGKRSSSSSIIGPFERGSLKSSSLASALNTWVLLLSATQPGTSSFSYSVGGKDKVGREADRLFRVRLLFSSKAANQIKVSVRPPAKP